MMHPSHFGRGHQDQRPALFAHGHAQHLEATGLHRQQIHRLAAQFGTQLAHGGIADRQQRAGQRRELAYLLLVDPEGTDVEAVRRAQHCRAQIGNALGDFFHDWQDKPTEGWMINSGGARRPD